jgi:hypothetical protein
VLNLRAGLIGRRSRNGRWAGHGGQAPACISGTSKHWPQHTPVSKHQTYSTYQLAGIVFPGTSNRKPNPPSSTQLPGTLFLLLRPPPLRTFNRCFLPVPLLQLQLSRPGLLFLSRSAPHRRPSRIPAATTSRAALRAPASLDLLHPTWSPTLFSNHPVRTFAAPFLCSISGFFGTPFHQSIHSFTAKSSPFPTAVHARAASPPKPWRQGLVR